MTKLHKRSAILISCLLAVLGLLVLVTQHNSLVYSQTEPGEITENIDAEIAEQERQLLKAQYRSQAQEYQNNLREFSVAKAEFQKIETLASLEKAISATREVFRARNELLITYVQQLQLELRANPAYQEDLRTQLLERLKKLENELIAFNQLVLNSQDRQALTERADGFIPISLEIELLSTETRMVILLGKFRASAGLAQQLTSELKEYHEQNPVSALKQGERQRAYQELTSVESSVQKVWLLAIEYYQELEPKDFEADTYTDFAATLSPMQSGLIRWYTYLEQAMKL